MHVRPLALHTTLVGLILPGLMVLSGSAPAQADDPPIVARSGSLTQRPTGLPRTDTAARQVRSAAVTTAPRDDRARATVTLRVQPTSTQNTRLRLTLGEMTNGVCAGQVEYSTPTYGATSAGWTRSGATYTLNSTAELVFGSYDCAHAALTELNGTTTTYDLLGGTLAPTYARARLQVGSARLLGSRKLKLVPGVWTPIVVKVRNAGDFESNRITITGAGKRLRVRSAHSGYSLEAGDTASLTVKVKLTKKRRSRLRLAVRGSTAAKVSKHFTVRPRKAPPRIRDGRYRSANKSVTFRIKRGKVTGFRIYAFTTCGGYPGLPTYTRNYYSVKNAKVPRSGVISIVERGTLYTARLVGFASGRKVTRAEFRYSGPDRCRATVRFKARRIG